MRSTWKVGKQNCAVKDTAIERYNRKFGNNREYVEDTVLKEEKAVKMSEFLERHVRKLSQKEMKHQVIGPQS